SHRSADRARSDCSDARRIGCGTWTGSRDSTLSQCDSFQLSRTSDGDRLFSLPAEIGVDSSWPSRHFRNSGRHLSVFSRGFAADSYNSATGSNRMTGLDAAQHSRDVRRATPSNAVVEARDLARDYKFGDEDVHALRGVTFDVGERDYVAIVGPSGCGKSTLLNMLGVIDQPTRGTVRIRGHDVGSMRDREATSFRLHNIGFVFQRFYLMPTLSAVENIE